MVLDFDIWWRLLDVSTDDVIQADSVAQSHNKLLPDLPIGSKDKDSHLIYVQKYTINSFSQPNVQKLIQSQNSSNLGFYIS